MKIILSFDYEVFFGPRTGNIHNCIEKPIEKLNEIAEEFGIRYCFFVDIGFLLRLEALEKTNNGLSSELKLLNNNLEKIASAGHEFQLHIHPHWENSNFSNGKWEIDYSSYRLHKFSDSEIESIVSRYSLKLREIADNNIIAFRAGGWSLQPFSRISKSLKKNGIIIESSVFKGGFSRTPIQNFDFRNAPGDNFWKFNHDPLEQDSHGHFVELPINSFNLYPDHYFRLMFLKLIQSKIHQSFGNGTPAKHSKKELLKLFYSKTTSAVSMDGLKSNYLISAKKKAKEKYGNDSFFVVIGHPKAQSAFSLSKITEFIKHSLKYNDRFVTYEDFFKYTKQSILK